MSLLTIFGLVSSVLMIVLQNAGIVSSSETSLVMQLLLPLETLINNLKSGQSAGDDALSVLTAVGAVIAALKASTSLSAADLDRVNALNDDLTAATAAYIQSGKGIDLTMLAPIVPAV